jgi:predicted metal-dependent enzyme (double-stranded beta helix superfamily)
VISMDQVSASDNVWSWPDSLDACVAAPASHLVLLENETVRVLEVVIEPGVREPTHTHRAHSVMIVDEPARIRYYTADTLTFETPTGGSDAGHRVSWMAPEPPHSVENIDVHRYHAYRIELKAPATQME